ncbi:MAG: DUF2029 domain-containing protein [Chloroflexi bacterium]|nr:DUF2029 domain-containing protein [Chloroflexota bacterium]
MNRTLPGWLRGLFVALVPVVLILLTYANYDFVVKSPGGNDFLARWMGAKAWVQDGISPYDPSVSLETQEVIYGRPARPESGEDIGHFVYPLPSMIFFAPFGLLPFQPARAIWMTILEVGLILLSILGFRIAKWNPGRGLLILILLFSLTWYHGIRAVILGQFAIIEAILMVGALIAIQRKNDLFGGLLLALSMAKPQMAFLLIPFVIFWAISRKRWGLVASIIGFNILLFGGFMLLMPDWPLQWITQVIEYPAYSPAKPFVAIIADFFPGISSGLNLGLSILFIGYMLWEWVLAMAKDDRWFQWTAAITIVITSAVVLRTATTNYLAMVPAMMIIFSIWAQRWKLRGEIGVAAALILLFFGLWILFIRTVNGNLEDPVMYLPLPTMMLLGLWWVRWWFIRPVSLPYEDRFQ